MREKNSKREKNNWNWKLAKAMIWPVLKMMSVNEINIAVKILSALILAYQLILHVST